MNKTNKISRLQLYNNHYEQEALHYKNYLSTLGHHKQTAQRGYFIIKEFFMYVEALQINQLKQITNTTIKAYQEYITQRKNVKTNQKLTNKTILDHLRNIQKYLAYLLQLGKIKINPASSFTFKYPTQTKEKFVFTTDQIQELFHHSNTLERAILNIGYCCGLRVGEIEKLTPKDIQIHKNRIIVQNGKNNKRRIIPITNQVASELKNYLRNLQNKEILFLNKRNTPMRHITFNKILKQIITKTSLYNENPQIIQQISFHTLRHSIATHLLQNGMKLEQVQYFLGHNELQATEIYTHVNENQLKKLITNTINHGIT
jgi:integrase/recombinase XerD